MNDLIEYLKTEFYFELREIPGRGICGLQRMAFTVGLFYNIDQYTYEGRYDPSGPWIKHKGYMKEYSNPNIHANKRNN